MEQMIPLANVKPEIFDNIDADATFRSAHKTLDAPVETLTNPDQVQEIRQQKAEQMQQMEERGAMAQDAATAKDIAKAAKDVGMEEMVGGALGGQAQ